MSLCSDVIWYCTALSSVNTSPTCVVFCCKLFSGRRLMRIEIVLLFESWHPITSQCKVPIDG